MKLAPAYRPRSRSAGQAGVSRGPRFSAAWVRQRLDDPQHLRALPAGGGREAAATLTRLLEGGDTQISQVPSRGPADEVPINCY